jgi:cephalosporin hydroxylase
MKHVLAELKLYAPMVAPGSYVIVQDGNVNGHPVVPNFGPGPYEATEAFLTSDDRFIADRSREWFLFTMHPKGYLKRIK